MDHNEILSWLREDDPARLAELWRHADDVRREYVGDEVHLRGLIEISNHCVRHCAYCGLRADHGRLARYRMTEQEILTCVRQAVGFGYGTIVLQSGEDPGITRAWMERVIRHIKAETPLAVTLSLGEREPEELAAWRAAGADRYLLKFETSRRALYERIHPPRAAGRSDRLALLAVLGELGYEVGSGAMVGIPGQSYDDLARDIKLFASLELDMIGVGPYLPHPETPLGEPGRGARLGEDQQAPNTELMTCKVVALTRLVCPRANIPATTALATAGGEAGRDTALQRGANVVMPNLTPTPYRRLYEIYPERAGLDEMPEEFDARLREHLAAISRPVGRGHGDSPRGLSRFSANRRRQSNTP